MAVYHRGQISSLVGDQCLCGVVWYGSGVVWCGVVWWVWCGVVVMWCGVVW